MNEVAVRAAHYLWHQSVQILILVPLFWLACRCLKKASAHWRYLLGLVLLVKCLVPPFCVISLPVLPEMPMGSHLSVSWQKLASNIAAPVRHAHTVPAAFANEVGSQWWFACLSIGVAGFFGALVLKLALIRNRLRRERQPPSEAMRRSLRLLLVSSQLKRLPLVWTLPSAQQPFVWGLCRGEIYVPLGFEDQGTWRQRHGVLMHEVAHVLRWDALVNLIQLLIQGLFFFHPFVWQLNRHIRHEREKCCDEMAVAFIELDSVDYSRALIDRFSAALANASPRWALAISNSARALEDRISSLLQARHLLKEPTLSTLATISCVASLLIPMHVQLVQRAAVVNGIAPGPAHAGIKREIWAGPTKSSSVARNARAVSEPLVPSHAKSETTRTDVSGVSDQAPTRFLRSTNPPPSSSRFQNQGTGVTARPIAHREPGRVAAPVRSRARVLTPGTSWMGGAVVSAAAMNCPIPIPGWVPPRIPAPRLDAFAASWQLRMLRSEFGSDRIARSIPIAVNGNRLIPYGRTPGFASWRYANLSMVWPANMAPVVAARSRRELIPMP